MHTLSPFGNLFHVYGSLPASHSAAINSEAYDQLVEQLARPLSAPGQAILLSAPRAGYGKSHLLSMVQMQFTATHEFILLRMDESNKLSSETVIANVLAQLSRPLPGGAGLTALDLLTRHLFALGLEPLVRSGELPCQDREQALHSFSQRPAETFDFHHPAAATAHWVRKNFEVLRPRLADEISQLIQASSSSVGFWINVMFDHAVKQSDHSSRKNGIMHDVFDSSHQGSFYELLITLLKLLSQTHRVVLVADDLEEFSTNSDAALHLISFLTSLNGSVERLSVILSINDDLWENAFLPKLTCGLLDRISEVSIRLEPLAREQAMSLLASRDPHATSLIDLIRTDQVLYARALLRHAQVCWGNHGVEMAVAQNFDAMERANQNFTPPEQEHTLAQDSGEYSSEVSIYVDEDPVAFESTGELVTEPSHIFTTELEPAVTPFFVDAANPVLQDFSTIVRHESDHATVAADFRELVNNESHFAEKQKEEARVDDLLRRFRERYNQS